MSGDEVLARLLLDLALLLAVAQLLRLVLVRLRQPEVLAYVLAGIALGPSLLGRLPGDPSALLFPEEVRAALAPLGTLGLVMFAFAIGLELDLGALRRRSRSVLNVSAGSLGIPLACGAALALVLYPVHGEIAGAAIPPLAFGLFIATAMAISAFPVLVSIVSERGMRRTPVGELAVSSAALEDLCGWLLLTLALAAMPAAGGDDFGTMVLHGATFGLLVIGARPLLRRLLARAAAGGDVAVLAVALGFATACAGFTQLIGLHVVMGAFVAGIAFPRDGDGARIRTLCRALIPVTLAIFLPIYFLSPGLALDVGSIGAGGVPEMLLIIAVACAAKLAGGAIPARLSGMSWAEAGTLGVLLNTRGLMELVVLTVGYSEGVLTQRLFSELVVMAIVTTMMTGPLLELLRRRGVGTDIVGCPPAAGGGRDWDWDDSPEERPLAVARPGPV